MVQPPSFSYIGKLYFHFPAKSRKTEKLDILSAKNIGEADPGFRGIYRGYERCHLFIPGNT
jgi:hypothetical protein